MTLTPFLEEGKSAEFLPILITGSLLAAFSFFITYLFKKISFQSRLVIFNIGLLLGLALMGFQYNLSNPFVILFLWFGYLFAFYKINHRSHQNVVFLIPFTLPFIAVLFILEMIDGYPDAVQTLIIFLAALITFSIFPLITVILWRCKDLSDSELKDKLNEVCRRADFKHAGLKTWGVLDSMMTAGIMGLVPRFRYVLFTQSLLNKLSDESLQAVLAHEIGHSKKKHLLIYPFILLGIVMLISVIIAYLPPLNMAATYALYVVLLAVLFRLVFGFYSRLFERQADLYILHVGLPIEYMIDALDDIGYLTGKSHKVPSWHHFSLEERIEFLKKVKENPDLADKHNQKTFYYILIYFLFFILIAWLYL